MDVVDTVTHTIAEIFYHKGIFKSHTTKCGMIYRIHMCFLGFKVSAFMKFNDIVHSVMLGWRQLSGLIRLQRGCRLTVETVLKVCCFQNVINSSNMNLYDHHIFSAVTPGNTLVVSQGRGPHACSCTLQHSLIIQEFDCTTHLAFHTIFRLAILSFYWHFLLWWVPQSRNDHNRIISMKDFKLLTLFLVAMYFDGKFSHRPRKKNNSNSTTTLSFIIWHLIGG